MYVCARTIFEVGPCTDDLKSHWWRRRSKFAIFAQSLEGDDETPRSLGLDLLDQVVCKEVTSSIKAGNGGMSAVTGSCVSERIQCRR